MKKLVVLLILILIPIWGYWDVRYTTLGQWQVALSNFGKFGQSPSGDAGAFWPRGTNHNYIYGSGIWVGSILPNGDTLVTIGYGPHGGEAEFAPGLSYSNPLDSQWHVYFSTDWDYPFTPISLEDGYAIYNDFNTNYHMPDSFHVPEPLGITVTLKTYVWLKDWADDIVFIKYIIKNDTNYTINNVYAGICMDYDIGNEGGTGNDRGGIDLTRKLFYGWQEQPEPGWAEWPGMIGLKLLSPYSLSAFKRFTLNLEPEWDRQRYAVLAGYNWQTGNYEPYDTIWPPPDDQRILMSTGVWNLAPEDSIVLDWALIAGEDSMPPSPDLERKADKSQIAYDSGFHNVQITQPNGGEIISGTYPITYSASSVTPNPLLIDIYLISENGFDTIAIEQNNTGNFNWNTTLFSDGVLNRVIVMAYDTITFGGDISDSYFIINNPGNAPPFLQVISPQLNETLTRDFNIIWFARDPEFLDSLYVNIYFKSQYDTIFQLVALNELNDSVYTWNTLPYRNGSGLLVVEACDDSFTVSDTIPVYLLNQISGGPINHINGLNNCVDLSVLVHQPEYLTGHTYELRFLQYRRLASTSYPEYIYEIVDSNTGVTVLDTHSLEYDSQLDINDYSPIIDGFSVWSRSEENIISQLNFHNDSVRVVLGSYPEDSIVLLGSPSSTWWAYRGARLQSDWALKPGGGLTLLVTDLDYGDTIPYKPYIPFFPFLDLDSAFGWCFHNFPPPNPPPSDTLRATDKFIYLCGDRIKFSRTIPPPQVGDRWLVYPSPYSPPIKGNVYRFTPINYVAETRTKIIPISFQVYPVPFTKTLTIAYSLPKPQKINLIIYDVLGRQVKKLKDGVENPGSYKIIWNGLDNQNRKVSSGIYFCRFTTENYKRTKKFILIKY